MMARTLHRTRLVHRTALGLLAGFSLSLASCGPSKADYQAQLDKYNKLAKEHEATEDELAKEKARAEKLEAELEAMGYKLNATGAENDKLLKALDEYKERADALERIKKRFEKLRKKLEELTKLGLKISIRKNRMVISLPGDVLFASGKDELQAKGKEILAKVAQVVRDDNELAKRTYQVAGHTDNEKITSAVVLKQFKDNWGLSLMRARTVLLYLIAPSSDPKSPGGGLDPSLWSASGYGETDPIASNAGKYGKEKNRRVELIMMPNVEEMLDLKSLADEGTEKEIDEESQKEATRAEVLADAKEAEGPPKPAAAKPAAATKPAEKEAAKKAAPAKEEPAKPAAKPDPKK